MLQSLITLSDQDIEVVITAVQQWCTRNHCDIDSNEGHRALTLAIDLVQNSARDTLLHNMTERLGSRAGQMDAETSGAS
ncbi:hypothetical protein ACC808_27845 [Rhizobium ruizarguesonis]|uniref:hypothetical protein n=1 Tax=Rhizobium ruizarguesonis TaxID=2081791 RepID=UPI00102FA737|nr:hypothetical protein [Rhizobium ruizarguesonis]NKL44563.1 hypothetical protein [Rhizobium leguminosarum bv. viciae]TBD36651.1 hypothetical protein ELH18_03750 [Rhizobium ruizarguesonis]TBD41417.1 hypothetical protein ELH19_03765 [Rhizobium ruizarguesonis]TBD57763.1 hypothetical protein ELH15_03750 [Rhizobium ruizarguesonis]TBD84029.1 hypothetical protein ELH13_03755 [Rhizobium ruizarguesonis]